ncbi:TlpA family protein disulfide reductase [Fulvivirga sp. 29W222]|uniref:TlpA family protein disulfide reductase n=1 Tax=Fulvivirga marina TaxID=2494733 RepID=A0A937FWF8_9BACT|nr:TlpA disulfide reductase family protein [Fulvivirga marina]MBL6447415.1 TlpA family protein disulfide reductase [Fulvivirga marina]
MNKNNILFFLLFILGVPGYAQKAEVIKFDRLEALISQESEKVMVINFWATWCGPCVKELPYFKKLDAENEDVNVYLISLDFVEKLDRVNAFIERKELVSPVLLLDEMDYNSWIDKVDESWSGAIPATLVINAATGQRKFVEKELEEGELEKLIAELSN